MNRLSIISAAGMVCGETLQLDSRSSARGTASSHSSLETPAAAPGSSIAGQGSGHGERRAEADGQFMVLYRNRYPVRIIGQVRGGVFSLVSRAEATRFHTEGEGRRAALAAGMNPQHIFIQSIEKQICRQRPQPRRSRES